MSAKPNPHCRIGRIKPKNGGATIRVLDREQDPVMNPIGPKIMDAASTLARDPFFDDVIGFYLVAWRRDGQMPTTHGYLPGSGGPPAANLPSLIEERVRRDFVTAQEVRRIVDREYVTPQDD